MSQNLFAQDWGEDEEPAVKGPFYEEPAAPTKPTNSSRARIEKKQPTRPRTGRVVNNGAMVYRASDFDAKVIATLPAGKVYPISSTTVGAFYKIKVKDGVYGYIADNDIKPILSAAEKKENAKKKNQNRQARKRGPFADEEEENPWADNRKKSFEEQRYRGLEIAQITYKEDTMGVDPKEPLMFFGFKATGPKVLVDGSYMDANVKFHYGAPKYYADATGKSADGFVLLMDLLFQTPMEQGPNTLVIFGFGPMLKYSKFSTSLNVGGRTESYDMVDMSVGAAFNLGIAQRFGSFALRGELQYYWEKTQYSGLALAIQLPF